MLTELSENEKKILGHLFGYITDKECDATLRSLNEDGECVTMKDFRGLFDKLSDYLDTGLSSYYGPCVVEENENLDFAPYQG